jgi:quercetin dioxygenase-like cupin family protein
VTVEFVRCERPLGGVLSTSEVSAPRKVSCLGGYGTGFRQATVVVAGAGLSVENPVGGVLTFKAMSDETGGVVTALETIAARGEGPPLHVHAEDELIYTLEGVFRIKLGDVVHELTPGSFVFIPNGTPHAWQNIGNGPARFFATIMPGATRFEEFFRRYAELPADQRGVEAFARLAAETEAFEVLGPRLAQSDPL